MLSAMRLSSASRGLAILGLSAVPCQPRRGWAWCRGPRKRRGSVADLVSGNVAIGQSGGPTAVINQSLVGVIEGLKAGLCAGGHVKRILGMRHGVRGIVKPG